MSNDTRTLYERVGGEEGIQRLVGDFYARVLADPCLSPFFENTSIEKLQRMQQEFFRAALDGNIQYSGDTLNYVHQGRGITRQHLARFVDHLFATLGSMNYEDEDVRAVIARINTYKNDILGEVGVSG